MEQIAKSRFDNNSSAMSLSQDFNQFRTLDDVKQMNNFCIDDNKHMLRSLEASTSVDRIQAFEPVTASSPIQIVNQKMQLAPS